jgi:hypothetical protein
MQKEIIFSGFGGQGALFAGQVLSPPWMLGMMLPGCLPMDLKCAAAQLTALW